MKDELFKKAALFATAFCFRYNIAFSLSSLGESYSFVSDFFILNPSFENYGFWYTDTFNSKKAVHFDHLPYFESALMIHVPKKHSL